METVRRRKYPAVVTVLILVAAAIAGQFIFAGSIEEAEGGLIARGFAAVRQAISQRTLQGGWPVVYSNGNI